MVEELERQILLFDISNIIISFLQRFIQTKITAKGYRYFSKDSN